MKKILLLALLLVGVSGSAFADCAKIKTEIEDSLKETAALNSTANSYRAAGYSIKANSFDMQIANSKHQTSLLITQMSALKCKPYSGSLNPEKYKNAVKKCSDSVDSSIEEINHNCDRNNWKPE